MSIFCALYTQVLLDAVARIGTLEVGHNGTGKSAHDRTETERADPSKAAAHIKGSLCLECLEGLGSVPEGQFVLRMPRGPGISSRRAVCA